MSAGDRRGGPTSARRGLLVPGLFAALCVALFGALGVWQMRRLAWKEALIARIEAREAAAPAPLAPQTDWPRLAPDDYAFRRVALMGAFEGRDALVFAGPVSPDRGPAQPGYFVLTPFRLATGGVVFVSRGFAPMDVAERGAYAAPPQGEVEIVGRLRPPERRGAFTPADAPDRNRFFAVDAVVLGAAQGLAAAPFAIDAETISGAAGAWPRPLARVERPPNNHLSYALTWFGLAATAAAFFAVWALRR